MSIRYKGARMSDQMKLFKKNGFLSEVGESTFRSNLDKEISTLLSSAENEAELRIIGSLISNRVGNMVADRVAALNKPAETKPMCNGSMWRDEYGNETFTHDLYTFCPACDSKK